MLRPLVCVGCALSRVALSRVALSRVPGPDVARVVLRCARPLRECHPALRGRTRAACPAVQSARRQRRAPVRM